MNNQECTKCEGIFSPRETICEGDNGKLYCEACFGELEEAHE